MKGVYVNITLTILLHLLSLLLVSLRFTSTSPRLNGVPLRRVAQAYVIATSTSVDISNISLPTTLTDAYFTRSKVSGGKDKEGEFFKEGEEKKVVSEEKKGEQKVRILF